MKWSILALIALILIFNLAPHWALLMGLALTLSFNINSDLRALSKLWSSRILQLSIIFMGASLNFSSLIQSSTTGIFITFTSISLIFLAGYLLNKIFKIDSPLNILITTGTAICGGSAIAATGPVLKADSVSMAASLGVVFILNAIAVFLFPPLGHWMNLSDEQFGVWSALAIHDTSSVVAATQLYSAKAAQIGATLKLTRALWIIPLTLVFSTVFKSKGKIQFPWFIFGFLLTSLVFTFIPELSELIPLTSKISKFGLAITLFLIGISLNKDQIKSIGTGPLKFGLTLWLLTLVGSLLYVRSFI